MIVGFIGMASCNLPSGTSTPANGLTGLDAIQTAAAQTLEAQSGYGVSTQAPVTTQVFGLPTVTARLTSTSFPTATSTESTPCDRIEFVEDVTIPDGMAFSPGDTFTKTWRLRNSGSCTWTTEYTLVFQSGDAMGAAASAPLTNSVAPNETVDISVNMTAPNSPGKYRGDWKLRNASGVSFGLGNSSAAFFVEIDVVSTVDFTIEFDNTHICGGQVYATVKIVNTGIDFLSSVRITVNDLDTSTLLYGPGTDNKAFMITPTGCPPGENDADPGLTYYIAVSIGAAPASGNRARYTLMVCTENALAGTCVEKSVDFVIP